ncbi:MAG TPA: SigE family RNA polymerase sigma factor [Jatrophihabitans sp.]|nr:SigE family RNA polymerase sigma factor [Jatrophihabitans sp.]
MSTSINDGPHRQTDPRYPESVDAAIGTLFRQRRVDLFRLAVFLVDDRAAAEDLVQDAFATLHRRWQHLDDPAASYGYLRSTVVNAARHHNRHQAVQRRHLKVAEPEDEPGADYLVLLAEEHQQVLRALRTLPARQRAVVVLRYWEQLTEAEIAATLGISTGTVKSSASRAMHTLKQTLEGRQ